MKQPHSRVQRGKKVKVHLKNGEEFIAKFHEKHGNRIMFYDHSEIMQGDLEKFIIYKPKQ